MMARKDIGLEGYERGNGFQPAIRGLSVRDFLKATLPYLAAYVIIALLRTYLGDPAAIMLIGAATGAILLASGVGHILRAERFNEGKTEEGSRRVRIEGVVLAAVGAAVATLCIVCLWKGYAIDPRWFGLFYPAMALLWLAFWMFPSLVRRLRPDGEAWPDEAPISNRRQLALSILFVLIFGIVCVSTYMESTHGFAKARDAFFLPALVVLIGLVALAMPRNEDAPVDMRPAWAVASILLAIFLYFMISV